MQRHTNFTAVPLPRQTPVENQLAAAVSTAVLAGLLACLAPNAHAKNDKDDYAKGRLLVEVRAGLSDADLDTIVKGQGGKKARRIGQSNLHIVDLPPGLEKQTQEKLARHPLFKSAELDQRVKLAAVPNDPYYGSEWHLAKIGAAQAWDKTSGAGVTIAILDSGVESGHPDLAANMVAGYNAYDNNSDTTDVCGHGTAVAGTAAAVSNNGTGVAGIAGQAKIMPVRVAYFDTGYNSCYAYYSTIATGITWAADHGARIANASFGGVASSSAIQSAAQYMKNKGGLVFVSAGNNGVDEGFAPTTTMIAVSATDSNDAKTSWSSYGGFVSLSAPGSGLWSTSRGAQYGTWNGTSFASPLAAGVAALMMAAAPSLSAAQIEQKLFATAVDLGAAGRDPQFGYGRVNAAAGVAAVATTTPPADTTAPDVAIAAPYANATVAGLVAVNVTASDNVGVTNVELLVNGNVVAADSSAPYGYSWDSKGQPNGMVSLSARATDAAGNVRVSAPVSVNVANVVVVPPPAADTSAPSVAIAKPVAGAVTGNVSVMVNATDNFPATGIKQTLYIDGAQVAQGTGAMLGYSWNTRKYAFGNHTVMAVAVDAAGNRSQTSVVVTRK
ncbi:MAG TPA: S8 family serine peptidase [Burkholderiaceae bacterium]